MKLYGISGSPNTWKVRATAHHLGIDLAFAEVDIFKGENRTREFLALSPSGRTPVLVDGNFALWESNAIMQFLAGLKPNDLWPDDRRARADIMRWQSWQLAHWGKEACEPLIFENMLKPMFGLGAPDALAQQRAGQAFTKEAALLDRHLDGRPWLVGDAPTLAEYAVGSYLFLADAARLPVGDHPRLAAWFARVAALPSWQATAPAMARAA